jgi:phospholipase D1/2
LDADIEPRASATIASLRNRLLAEHLGATPERIEAELRSRGSLIATIDALRGGPRSLEPLPPPSAKDDAEVALDLTFLDGLVADPERPASDKLLETFVPDGLRHPVRRSLAGWAVLVAVALVLAAIWRWTPMSALLDVERAAAFARGLAGHRAAPVLVLVGYILGGLVLFPITVLLGATALVFSPPLSIVYCLVGTLASAAVTFEIGRLAKWRRMGWLQGPRMRRISVQLRRRGTVAIVAARLLPIGSFSLINVTAGAFGVRFRDFMLGNVIGVLPGVLALTLLADRLGDTLRHPHPRNIALLIALAAVFFLIMAWLRRRLASRAR